MAPNHHAIPPTLPPSVEEAYRRKCVQLKQRSHELDEANDATRLRLGRLKKQAEKMRIERAFLLEQLAKRTSTNVEDSDGSPSPPPTPKEKPLRSKRGHRKPTTLAELEKPTGGGDNPSQNAGGLSPASESFPAGAGDSQETPLALFNNSLRRNSANRSGSSSQVARPERPANAFEMWSEEERKTLLEKHEGEEDFNIEEELAREWKRLDEKEREEWLKRSEEKMAQYQKDKDAYSKSKAAAEAKKAASTGGLSDKEDDGDVEADAEMEETQGGKTTQDEDVEMANYDTEDQGETPGTSRNAE